MYRHRELMRLVRTATSIRRLREELVGDSIERKALMDKYTRFIREDEREKMAGGKQPRP